MLGRVVITATVLLTVACTDGLTNREQSCLDAGNDWQMCTGQGNAHEREMARINSRQGMGMNHGVNAFQYPDVHQGDEYTDYYGNEQYGSWNNGQYRFHNPQSSQAISTNSFLLGAGIAGLAAYAIMPRSNRTNWTSTHKGGWKATKYRAKKNISRKGKTLTAAQYKARKVKRKARVAARKAKVATKNGINKAKKITSAKSAKLKNKLKNAQKQRNLKKNGINLNKNTNTNSKRFAKKKKRTTSSYKKPKQRKKPRSSNKKRR